MIFIKKSVEAFDLIEKAKEIIKISSERNWEYQETLIEMFEKIEREELPKQEGKKKTGPKWKAPKGVDGNRRIDKKLNPSI